MKLLTTVLAAHLLLPCVLFAQETAPDTAFVAAAATAAQGAYIKGIANHSNIYNGIQYRDALRRNNDVGHAFFQSDDWQTGSVFYDDNLYANVYLQYDLVADKIIVEHGYSFFKLQLVKEKVRSFTIDGHRFVHLADDGSNTINDGFYEVLHEGKANVYMLRRKISYEKIESGGTKFTEYKEIARYFLYHDGKYYNVKNKRSVIKSAGTDKKAMRKYIQQKKIRFGKDRATPLIQAAGFYDDVQP